MYVVDYERRIVYCNPALAAWLDLEQERIVGRLVEYHSEPAGAPTADRESAAPLADLCPPPRALAGESCGGTISCVARDGRLVHRRADFVPLASQSSDEPPATLVLLATCDMSPQEVTSSAEPSADQLHRTIRQFRRAQAAHYAIESLLGDSSAICKVRAQVAAAAASGANVLVVGREGSGRRHVARAIHYHSAGEAAARLVPVDCEVLSDNLLRRAIDTLQNASQGSQQRPTLLLENLETLSAAHQSLLASAIRQGALPARVIATLSSDHAPGSVEAAARSGKSGADSQRQSVDAQLFDALSTITINIPRLVDRLEDLPVLAQCLLEACNRGSDKQVGRILPEAFDLLALHSWPGELSELREVISAAHRNCASHEIGPSDLPAVIHHAKQAAARVRRPPERIELVQFLADIEKEVISRALTQARGNKTEAAELLGMTRPRLYRRLVQLGLVEAAASDAEAESPEFIEQDSTDQSP